LWHKRKLVSSLNTKFTGKLQYSKWQFVDQLMMKGLRVDRSKCKPERWLQIESGRKAEVREVLTMEDSSGPQEQFEAPKLFESERRVP
jgi:hypothetical protein